MRHPSSTERQSELVESLKQFLEVQSKNSGSRETLYCRDCGCRLIYLEMQFWPQEENQSWNTPLPYCERCHPLPVRRDFFAA
jgi:hypothetical protein